MNDEQLREIREELDDPAPMPPCEVETTIRLLLDHIDQQAARITALEQGIEREQAKFAEYVQQIESFGNAANDRIMALEAALRGLVEEAGPIELKAHRYDCYVCGVQTHPDYPNKTMDDLKHDRDCAWVAARKALGEGQS